MLHQFLEAGKVVGTHGLHGELRVDPWCDSAAFLTGFKRLYWDKGAKEGLVESSRVHKNQLLLKLKGIDTVEQGDTLRGKVLYIRREDAKLDEGSYFMQDLIGMDVYDADTFIYYGTLTDILQTGANDVYQITSVDKKNYLIPAIPDVIIHVNLEGGKMQIRPLKGIFDDAD
ncbi:16S rRNA processing protein RimM [Caproiciproducens galactitolivorans]|uniref:Ribosome maturation factor RimM n=1 Tax=Caproiciproducens galactitolivorans TaxID=642589 RepID=A0A4Z0Y9U5_9FIRM|nr:ribosome maturation factor RimM [Caproiciproducens galactitolivorans]QEY35844.1 16S rRNA processing protein RimM [Caproiciproducens galactitolivorans]TGJ75730.1 ribosome maturation factor RimM [Caproiciproducens galactitolivorans]